MSNFRVGQKVVCVDDTNWNHGYGDEIKPVKGNVYTVRGFSSDIPDGCGPRLFLVEIVNRPRLYFASGIAEASFCVWRFRPVVDRKTDTGMAILTKLLDDVKAKEPTS